MGFFKNIGNTIKKATKQISFKNIVKLGASLDPTGIAGGVVASIQAKKEEKKALAEQKKAEAEYQKQLELQNQAEAKKQLELMEQAKQNAEYQRMVIASNTQAVGGKIGIVAGSIGGQITKEALAQAGQQVNADLQTGLAKAGATMANQTMNEWLKMHWWKVLLAVVGIGFGLRMLLGGSRR
ncbi:hypothetical protein SAMN05192550_2809 [Flavobacterium glycines]|uniref:Uncharacterized protein n=1 Tax=Flavobacterium glycines TaxID=551990 RepID=A0A1B9DSN5_9FLAO|nr:hypothetical protein [Flavobacterium glycines]OCB72708.1 hypothetical protein FBGL_05130 [Flavobacterium glycines]GEL11815.1 hypothetical protein FGL01_25540 [Flavobacterium glycines]SDJ80643.1 hypothetical protein SAMN05192550_2809 [Flavobacterium glycines]